MRDPERINRILNKVRSAWLSEPDLRLGQMIGNISNLIDPYFIEDDELERRLDMVLQGEIER